MSVKLTPEEWQNIETKEGLEEVLTRICALAVEDALRVLPTVVRSLVAQAALSKKAADTFYLENRDLEGHKELVARVVEELESKSPGKTYADILNSAAPEIRKRLMVNKKIVHTGTKPDLEKLDHLAGMFGDK